MSHLTSVRLAFQVALKLRQNSWRLTSKSISWTKTKTRNQTITHQIQWSKWGLEWWANRGRSAPNTLHSNCDLFDSKAIIKCEVPPPSQLSTAHNRVINHCHISPTSKRLYKAGKTISSTKWANIKSTTICQLTSSARPQDSSAASMCMTKTKRLEQSWSGERSSQAWRLSNATTQWKLEKICRTNSRRWTTKQDANPPGTTSQLSRLNLKSAVRSGARRALMSTWKTSWSRYPHTKVS